jgi:DNA polymerase-3 subunit delta
MQLKAADARAFLARPDPKWAAVLFYGPDRGLVREGATALVTAAVGDAADPFNVALLTAEALKADPVRLDDELGALSLVGGRRAVWLQQPPAEALDALEAAFDDIDPATTLLVVEAGALKPRERLRQLFEGAKGALAVPCYLDEGANLHGLIRQTLKARGVGIDPAALAYLAESLGGDRLAIRGEIEKLALYKAGDASPVSREDAEACIGDGAPELMDDVVMAAASGDQQTLDRMLGRCLAAGTAPLALLRAQARHMMQLHRAAGRIAGGEGSERAIKALRPPVFFRKVSGMQQQLRRWTPERLAEALELLLEAELQCLTTGLPDVAICRRALMRLAQAARAGAR